MIKIIRHVEDIFQLRQAAERAVLDGLALGAGIVIFFSAIRAGEIVFVAPIGDPADSYENAKPNHRTGERQRTSVGKDGNWVVTDESGRVTQVNDRENERQPKPERKEEEPRNE